MKEIIKARWLVDHEQNKIAPKTLSSQVINEDGTLFKDTISTSLNEKASQVDLDVVSDLVGDMAVTEQIALALETIPQSDWNQNDTNAIDYVKNRTHWVEDDGETYHPLDEKFIPETIATKEYVENLYTKLNTNTVLGFYCIEDVTIVVNGISKVYPANSNVEIKFIEDDVFEIIPTSDNSILSLSAFPGALGTFYPWLEGVTQFSNILFDMNAEDMYSKWSQGNQGSYRVQSAQYTNCIFWSDNPYISDVSKRTNYTLTHTSQLPLCYSSIPDNTFKAFYLAFGVNSDPNWGNQAYRDSFAKATWATQVFSYYGARVIGIVGHDHPDFNIVLPKDCRGLMFDARDIESAGVFDAVNTTNFGAKSGSWREAFGDCTSLRRLYIKNLKVSLNISWSPIDYNSIHFIISSAANTNAITISVSPYTYNLLGQSDFELAASKNITIALITTNYVEDKRLSEIANKADKTELTLKADQTALDAVSTLIGDTSVSEQISEAVQNLATTTYVDNKVAGLVDSAPGTLDTLNELAKALGDDANFAATVSTQIGQKANASDVTNLTTRVGAVESKVGDTPVATQITTAIDAIPQADLAQTDTTAKDYVKNKPTSEDIVQMFMEMDVVQPMADENGAVYTDTDGKTFIL